MAHVPGLRSNYARVGRLVYFGRMLDKIRLQAAGKLPEDYHHNLGIGFDGRCCAFLGVDYPGIKARTLAGGSDAEVLAWCHERGGPRSDDQCNIWNRFLMKIGWRDDRTAALRQRIAQSHFEGKPIETFFDLNEFDEGRDPVATRAWELREPALVLLMGVAGSGKTTIGAKLATALGWNFIDADDFHPPANLEKMAAGLALNDHDRAPWLAALRAQMETTLARGESGVVACSALKESYRGALIADPARTKLVHLTGDPRLLFERLQQRPAHFMKAEMLPSQLEILEPPQNALAVDVAAPPDEIVAQIRRALSL